MFIGFDVSISFADLTSVSVPVPHLTARGLLHMETQFSVCQENTGVFGVWYKSGVDDFGSAFRLFPSFIPGQNETTGYYSPLQSLFCSYIAPALSVHTLL